MLTSTLTTRWMHRQDNAAVLAMLPGISETELLLNLSHRNIIAMVAVDDDDTPVGCVIYALHKHKIVIGSLVGSDDAKHALVERVHSKLNINRRSQVVFDAYLSDHATLSLLAEHWYLGELLECGEMVRMSYRMHPENQN